MKVELTRPQIEQLLFVSGQFEDFYLDWYDAGLSRRDWNTLQRSIKKLREAYHRKPEKRT